MRSCATCSTALPPGATACPACGTAAPVVRQARPRPRVTVPADAPEFGAGYGLLDAPAEAPAWSPAAPYGSLEAPPVVEQTPVPYGMPIGGPVPPPPSAPPTAPPPPSFPPLAPRPAGPPVVPDLLAGDWSGAALAVAAGLAVAAVLSIVLAGIVTIGIGGPDTTTFVQLVVALLTGGIGGGVHGVAGVGDGTVHVRFFLLTTGLLSFGTVAAVTRGRLRRGAAEPRAVALQVARVAVVWFAAVLLLTLLGQIGHLSDTSGDYGDGTDTTYAGIHPDVVPTVIRSTLLAGAAGAVAASSTLRGLVDARLGAWASTVRVQVAGLATLVALVTAFAVPLLMTLVLVYGDDESSYPVLALGASALPNLGVVGLLSGLGVPIGVDSGITYGSGSITDLVDRNPAWLLVIAGAVLVALLVSVAVALRAGSDARRQGLVQGAVLAVALPLLAVVTAPSARGGFEGDEQFSLGVAGSIHNSYGWAVLAGIVWGLVTAYVVPALLVGLGPATRRALGRLLLVREPVTAVTEG